MKRLFLIALIISVFAGIVFAQMDTPGNAFTSPQSTATAGRLRSNADNFIRPDSYAGINFNKIFTVVSYDTTTKANLGFAAKAGSIYIGAYYGGTFWANVPTVSYTESDETWLGVNHVTHRSYTALPTFTGSSPSNTLSVLVGISDLMGIRLSFFTDKRYFQDGDFLVGANQYQNYETEDGAIQPQLLWSMAKDLTPIGIKPYAAIDLKFNKDSTRHTSYKYVSASDSWIADDERLDSSDISNIIKFNVGLGGVTLVNKDGFKFSADLEYALNVTDYNNDYEYHDTSASDPVNYHWVIVSGFKGYVSGGSYYEISASSHTITPSVSGQWSGGPLSLRFKVNFGVPISVNSYTQKSLVYKNNVYQLENNGRDGTQTSVGFSPSINLGAQWKIIPTLALNLGGKITVSGITTTTNEYSQYGTNADGVSGVLLPYTSVKTVSNSTGANFTNTVSMGVTINATDNLTFEVGSGATSTINVFGNSAGDNGLLYFTKLLVALKF